MYVRNSFGKNWPQLQFPLNVEFNNQYFLQQQLFPTGIIVIKELNILYNEMIKLSYTARKSVEDYD